jgi:hypothetical protein
MGHRGSGRGQRLLLVPSAIDGVQQRRDLARRVGVGDRRHRPIVARLADEPRHVSRSGALRGAKRRESDLV